MKRDWSDSTVVILTCDRDREVLGLCLKGIERFWKGIKVAVLHDKDRSKDTDVPSDLRDLAQEIPYLRKVLDLPSISATDQIFCIDSDCLLVDEPYDWPDAAYLSVGPGCLGSMWLKWGSNVWESLGYPRLDESRIFCGGCWSAKRSEMFDPHRELIFDYLHECIRRGYHKHKFPGPVMEQCLLNGLWHMAYQDRQLPQWRYPLYHPTDSMAILHLSEVQNMEGGKTIIAKYKEMVA